MVAEDPCAPNYLGMKKEQKRKGGKGKRKNDMGRPSFGEQGP